MSSASSNWTVRAWLLFAATSAVHFLASNEADNDLWVHLLLGRRILLSGAIPRTDDLSFTATGLPWVDHEWLAQVVMAGVFDALGSTGLWLFKCAIALATIGLLWRSIRRHGVAPLTGAFVVVLISAVMSRGFATRPQIFTYCFVALLLAWLDRWRLQPTSLRIAIPVVALWLCAWANLHGAFIVGLGILGLWAISPPFPGVTSRVLLPAVALVAVCINPYGPALFTYILGELGAPHPLTEWQPVRFGDPAQWPFWFALAGVLLSAPFSSLWRTSPWRLALVVITAVLALRHQRHVPLFAICAALPLADQLDRAATRFSVDLSTGAQRLIAGAVAAMALLQIGLFAGRITTERATIVFEANEYPVNAVNFAKVNGLQGKMVLPLDWGGYVLWHLSPAIRVSMDGRFATVYSPEVVEQNFAFFAGDGEALLNEHRPDYVLAWANASLPALGEGRSYSVIFRDPVAVLYALQPTGGRGMAPPIEGRIPFP